MLKDTPRLRQVYFIGISIGEKAREGPETHWCCLVNGLNQVLKRGYPVLMGPQPCTSPGGNTLSLSLGTCCSVLVLEAGCLCTTLTKVVSMGFLLLWVTCFQTEMYAGPWDWAEPQSHACLQPQG